MMYHNILKAEGFEPKNAKNIGDFDSASELALWLEKRGWHPNWCDEPKDSVDFTIKQMQTFTKRLVEGEGNIGDQVADRRQQLELAARIEENGESAVNQYSEQQVEATIEYDEEGEMFDDDDAIN